jgi:ABC-type Na+ efflux pump permease subunit
VRAIVRKELLELVSNRAMLASMAALPTILTVTPMGIIWAYGLRPDDLAIKEIARYYHVLQPGVAPGASLIEALVEKWLGMFLCTPMFLPVLISSQAIAGEKEKRTIEPLLASPASELEILLGKSVAAVLPAIVLTWIFFVIFAVGADVLSYPVVKHLLVPNPAWLMGVLVLAPLLALLANSISVAISARVNDSRLAQQLSAMCVLPIVGVGATSLAGYLETGRQFYALSAVVIAALDVIVVWLSAKMFDRERVLTRWG